eukprot:1240916-Pyramimonas_sp.AAC.1
MAYQHFCNVSPQSYKIYYPPWMRFRLGSIGPPMTGPSMTTLNNAITGSLESSGTFGAQAYAML